MTRSPRPTFTPADPRATADDPSTVVVPLSGSSGSAGSEGLGGPLLVLVLALPALMLLVSMMPTHTMAAAGVVGRAVVHGRVVLAALALAVWLGVFVSLLLGGQV